MKEQTARLLQNLVSPDEGELHDIFGKVKNGKTFLATIMAYNDLMRGKIVYANWQIKWEGYDERKSKFKLFLGLLGLKRNYTVIPKENFQFLDPTRPDMLEKIASLTDCIIYLDEGHLYYDSYKLTKLSMSDRNTVLFTGHFNRTIKIISQRAMAIHVSLRSNVNRFFRVEKTMDFHFGNLHLVRFVVTEFQEMTNSEGVDLEQPENSKAIWGRKKYYELYNYKSMRGDVPPSQLNNASVAYLTWSEIKQRLFKNVT